MTLCSVGHIENPPFPLRILTLGTDFAADFSGTRFRTSPRLDKQDSIGGRGFSDVANTGFVATSRDEFIRSANRTDLLA